MNMSAIGRGDWDNGASAFPMASGDGPRAARRLVLPAPALFCVLPGIVGGRHRGHHGAARAHGLPSRLKEDAERISGRDDNE